MSDQSFIVDVQSLLTADFVSASILVSMGAVLGKVNAIQLILMSFIEVPIQVVNGYIGVRLFCAFDPGELMYVHTFGNVISSISIGTNVSSCSGAYFGLAVAFVLHRREVHDSPDEKSRYTSDAMIGTIFLFCFWPSFNSGSITGVDHSRWTNCRNYDENTIFSQKDQYFNDEPNWYLPDPINEEKSHPLTKSTLPKLL